MLTFAKNYLGRRKRFPRGYALLLERYFVQHSFPSICNVKGVSEGALKKGWNKRHMEVSVGREEV